MRRLIVLRPQPGATATSERARKLGLDVLPCPLFALEPLAWSVPDPGRFDYLLLTSANAVRLAGPGLARLATLPVIAVGEATAAAARAIGLDVKQVGTGGVADALAALGVDPRLLHLVGADHADPPPGHRIDAITTYRAAEIAAPGLPDPAGTVVLVHSPRAGARLANLVAYRSATAIAAISAAAAAACGTGWESIDWPERPSDPALLELAARLCQSPGQ